jgi:multiple sugar transport system substrate-binding protein
VIRYRGLTWDHPRGFNALAAAARRLDEERHGIAIDWDKQPLEGFESNPVRDLCARYDLVVLDHPHVGEAVASGCLFALEELFPPGDIATWSAVTIGPCLASYRYAGQHWALPLDAATQVMALRPDLLDERPGTWNDVVALSARRPVALCMAGPHPILTFLSLATAFGEPPAEREPSTLVSHETGEKALAIMAALYGRMPDEARGRNPIQLLAAMAEGDVISLSPLVYGYVNYAISRNSKGRPIVFENAPRAGREGRRGSTLGGTGIGVSRRCRITPALVDHLRWLLSVEAQVGFIPLHDGQPSRREAWHDECVNARCANFYRNTAETLEQAYVRPRHPGWIAFQTEASTILRAGLEERTPHPSILDRLQVSYTRTRPPSAER